MGTTEVFTKLVEDLEKLLGFPPQVVQMEPGGGSTNYAVASWSDSEPRRVRGVRVEPSADAFAFVPRADWANGPWSVSVWNTDPAWPVASVQIITTALDTQVIEMIEGILTGMFRIQKMAPADRGPGILAWASLTDTGNPGGGDPVKPYQKPPVRPEQDEQLVAEGSGRLLDPDCRDGKHGSCVGAPCECWCHQGVN